MVRETFDINFILDKLPAIIAALPITIYITMLVLIFGWLLGLLGAWGKVKGPKIVKVILGVLTDILRGIPTVVLLYIVYFGLPVLINVSSWSKITFVVLALTIELGTNSSELFRSAYASLNKGQLEAAHSLGYTPLQSFLHVIAPQGLYVIIPNLGSGVLSMIQATALVYTLGIFDILGRARQIDTNVSGVKTFEMYFAVAVIYWALSGIVTFIVKRFEVKFGKGRRVAR